MGEVLIELSNGAGGEARLFERIRAEGSAEGDAAASTSPDAEGFRPLRLQLLEVGIPIVNHSDIHRAQVEARDEGVEFRVIFVYVRVCIDRLYLREALEQRALIVCRGPGVLSGEQNG